MNLDKELEKLKEYLDGKKKGRTLSEIVESLGWSKKKKKENRALLEKWVEEFGASISFDQKMAEFDLKGSIAHVTMLGETGIITKEEALQIKQGLEELLEEYKAGKLEFDVSNGSDTKEINWSSY